MPESAARCRKEDTAAERREARRSAIRPVISGDPEMDPTARRVTGGGASAPAPVGALLPSLFLGEPKRTRGIRRPARNRAAELWPFDKRGWMDVARQRRIFVMSSRTVQRTDPGPM